MGRFAFDQALTDPMNHQIEDDLTLFSLYMRVCSVPSLEPEPAGDPDLIGKTVGLLNGASWVSLFATYFGRRILPGAKLIAVGNDAVQLHSMQAHRDGRPCPPQANIDRFIRYAEDLVQLHGADALLLTCSTMNRAAGAVREALRKYAVSVVQIDEAMMEAAAAPGGRILLVATHAPTVRNSRELLEETAAKLGTRVSIAEAVVEPAFHSLGLGDIAGHNETIAQAIREAAAREPFDRVVLAQISMSLFKLTYPEPERVFGVPVLTSGEEGFRRIRRLLAT
jgi:aspartate/glutamate racemase